MTSVKKTWKSLPLLDSVFTLVAADMVATVLFHLFTVKMQFAEMPRSSTSLGLGETKKRPSRGDRDVGLRRAATSWTGGAKRRGQAPNAEPLGGCGVVRS